VLVRVRRNRFDVLGNDDDGSRLHPFICAYILLLLVSLKLDTTLDTVMYILLIYKQRFVTHNIFLFLESFT
jgi:hypothetical protein